MVPIHVLRSENSDTIRITLVYTLLAVVVRQKSVQAGWRHRRAKIIHSMASIILFLFRFLRLLGEGHQAVALENLALRRQLAAFQRKRERPKLTEADRLFWIGLSRLWAGWKGALVVVQPETVLRWQRDRFRRFWAALSKSDKRRRGRPAVPQDVRRLVLQMAAANPLWRAPRIHANAPSNVLRVSIETMSWGGRQTLIISNTWNLR